MGIVNIEVKARCADPESVRRLLRAEGARFAGEDHQVDTYFHVRRGRLKLREGNIENALIYYDRPDQARPKRSDVALYPAPSPAALKAALTGALGVRIVVDKRREIYFIDNVKFHLDRVQGLGAFVEVEAIDVDGTHGVERLQAQCDRYVALLAVREEDLLAGSYSDLLEAAGPGGNEGASALHRT